MSPYGPYQSRHRKPNRGKRLVLTFSWLAAMVMLAVSATTTGPVALFHAASSRGAGSADPCHHRRRRECEQGRSRARAHPAAARTLLGASHRRLSLPCAGRPLRGGQQRPGPGRPDQRARRVAADRRVPACAGVASRRPAGPPRTGPGTAGQRPGRAAQLPSLTIGDGAARDGAARDGAARDGAARDGAARDGAARDGAARDGAARRSRLPAAAPGRGSGSPSSDRVRAMPGAGGHARFRTRLRPGRRARRTVPAG